MTKCAVCRTPFIKFRMTQKVCGRVECAIEQGRRDAAKVAKRKERAERAALKARREALMRVSDLLPVVQAAANAYIRERDRDLPCISCGRHNIADPLTGGAWDCGHYRSVGAAKHLRFDVRNMAKQCKHCNRDLAGNVVEYRRGLVARIGVDEVVALENDNRVHKWSVYELRELLEWFRAARRALVADRRLAA